jgi:hypothetical protein
MLIGRDPGDAETCVLGMVKSNLAATPCSLRFRIVGNGRVSKIEWLGESALTADNLIQTKDGEADGKKWALKERKRVRTH